MWGRTFESRRNGVGSEKALTKGHSQNILVRCCMGSAGRRDDSDTSSFSCDMDL